MVHWVHCHLTLTIPTQYLWMHVVKISWWIQDPKKNSRSFVQVEASGSDLLTLALLHLVLLPHAHIQSNVLSLGRVEKEWYNSYLPRCSGSADPLDMQPDQKPGLWVHQRGDGDCLGFKLCAWCFIVLLRTDERAVHWSLQMDGMDMTVNFFFWEYHFNLFLTIWQSLLFSSWADPVSIT